MNKLALTGSITEGSSTYGDILAPGAVTFSGLVTGDVVSSTATIVDESFSTSGNLKAGTYKQTATSIGDTDAENYSFTAYTTNDKNYTVEQKALTISGITAYDKTYDENTDATTNISGATFNGWITPDDLYLSATGKFSDPDIGNGKVVTLTTIYGGVDRNNYNITDQATTTASILAEALPDAPPLPLPPPVILGGVQPPLFKSALGLIVEYVPIASGDGAGLIFVAVPQAALTFGTTFTIPLPEEVQQLIADGGGAEVVSLDGGSPLPNWLKYDSATKVFSVDGATAGSLPVKVVLRIGDRSWTVEITT